MHQLEIVFLLMGLIIAGNLFAIKIKLPLPIVLTITGLLIGIFSYHTLIEVDPEVVFLIFLPPLLFEAAHNVSWQEFKEFKKPILILAIGLVIFTALCVAGISTYLIPNMSIMAGLLLGAIVAPPDAVAATSATKGLNIPKHITTILEGESLVNDASSLILYQFTLLALLSGKVSLIQLPLGFIIMSGGGVLLGLILALILTKLLRKIKDPTTITVISILFPMVIYIVAEELHISGVLAVVSSGLYLSWYSFSLVNFQTRFKMKEFWEVLTFILNGMIFILIGLQLPSLVKQFNNHQLFLIIMDGIIISLVVVFARILWIFPMALINIHQHNKKNSTKIPTNRNTFKQIFILSWAGMRGMVSLAIALALPLTMKDGSMFPYRNEIILIAFTVITVTLLLHGLTLPLIVKCFQIEHDTNSNKETEKDLRHDILSQSITYIDNEMSSNYPADTILELKKKVSTELKYRTAKDSNILEQEQILLEALRELIEFQQELLIDIQKNNNYPTEILRKIEEDIDILSLVINNKYQKWHLNEQNHTANNFKY